MYFFRPIAKQVMDPTQDHLPRDLVNWTGFGASLSLINSISLRLVALDYLYLSENKPECTLLRFHGLPDAVNTVILHTFVLSVAVAGFIEAQRAFNMQPTPVRGVLIPLFLIMQSLSIIADAAENLPIVSCVHAHQP